MILNILHLKKPLHFLKFVHDSKELINIYNQETQILSRPSYNSARDFAFKVTIMFRLVEYTFLIFKYLNLTTFKYILMLALYSFIHSSKMDSYTFVSKGSSCFYKKIQNAKRYILLLWIRYVGCSKIKM